MKRTFWLIPVLLVSFVFSGCLSSGGGEAVRLADLSNPFIGKWESRIPSMNNAKMVSEFKSDGTYTCGFPDVQGFEGPFNGGYLVFEDKMVSWLDFEGDAAYKFQVVDSNTINVTEIVEVKQGGELTLGNTSAFTRVTN
jgi:uncharacterized protein YodC (DUF2158 family)